MTNAAVSMQKSSSLNGKKLLLVRRVNIDDEHPFPSTSDDRVMVDPVGAGVDELVLLHSGSNARHVLSGSNEATDFVIVGVVGSLSR